MKLSRFLAILIAATLVYASLPGRTVQAAALVEVTNFGNNPSNLRMYLYVPNSVTPHPAILVAVHYCTGSGPAFYAGTEFAALADRYGFIVIYPSATRSGNCFDVSSPQALQHDGGSDPVGIVSMVRYVEQHFNGDPDRVYVTGASSGGMMTNVLLGDYPDVFKAGAAFMGVPFACFATTDGSEWNSTCANGQSIKPPQEWGDLVRGAFPGYSGPRPRMQVWHGTDDTTLRYPNFGEEIKQWTNVFGLSQTATSTDNPQPGWTRTRYGGTGPMPPVEAISVQGVGHSLPTGGMAAYALQFFGLAGDPNTFVQHGFEDGTTQGWGPRGSASVASVTDAAHSGTHSLKITGRTANWNGPSLDVRTLLQKGATYQISGHVRLVTGQPATQLIFTVQRTPTGGSTAFDRVVASPAGGVTDGDWVQLQGTYTYSTDVSELLLYLESSDATSQYYLDDFSITLLSAAPPDQSGVSSNFEDTTTQGWRPRVSTEILTVTSADKHGGNYSLLTTNRQHAYEGPSLDILGKLSKGYKYNVSVWVKLAPGEANSDVRVSIQRSFQGTTNFDTVIGNTAVTNAQWVNLAGSYTLNNDVDSLSIYVETASSLASFYIDDFSLALVTQLPIQPLPPVKDVLADDFLVGAAVEPDQLGDIHADLLKRHFNSITAENVMKPGPIQPVEGQFNWTDADKLVNFARANNIKVRGHTLVWHSQNPAWLFLDPSGNPMQPTPENKTLLLQRLENHIRAVAGRYKDDIYAWDVVNEVIDPAQADCMRRSTWFNITGLDYIKTAFRVAREAAPNAELFINDYSTTDSVKRTCLYNLTRDLRAEGVPIDGVGHQMHINIESPSAALIEQTIQLFAGLGVDQQITELDMSVYTNGTDSYVTVPRDILITQGYRYKAIFDAFRRQKDHISSVTFWGIADDHTWLKNFPITRLDLPLLFDEQLQAKYAYWGIVDPSQLPILIQQQNVAKGTPNINAQSEFLWSLVPWTQLQATGTLSASFKLLWDEQHLYVLAQVQDTTADSGDTVDVFIDDNNAKTPAYQDDDAHYTIRRGRPYAQGIQANVRPLADGYLVQAVLPLRTAATTGKALGFDIRVRDASAPNTPISWNDVTNTQDTDTSKFATLTLIDAVKWTIAAQGTPQIDGNEEGVWSKAATITTNTWVQGSGGATAQVKTLWDSGHLYIFARVTDPLLSKASTNPWEEDSIEVFVDQNNAKTSTYQADDAQYRVNFDNEQSFGGAASADKFVTATRIVSGGYIVEAAIQLDAIQAQPGTLVGFDFQVNDDGLGNGVRSSVVTWNDPTGNSYRNTSRFGVLRLMNRAR